MSTPRIPPLNTLGRGGLRGRSRGGVSSAGVSAKSQDEIVQATNDDAVSSRLSAVDAGYLQDPFAAFLTTATVQRRLPLMNRGTYVRTTGIDRIVDTFLASYSGRKQIVSLGAGSDTRYFRLRHQRSDLSLVYHELDFENNTKAKIERIKSPSFSKVAKDLCSISVDDLEIAGGDLRSSDYYIHAQDLRKLPESLPGVDVSLPTLLISECCLIYLAPNEAENALAHFTNMFAQAPLAVTIYEPIRPHDSFGRTMVRNLVSRGIHLQTMEKHADLQDQRQRLRRFGFEPRAEDMNFVWQRWIEETEKERVERLEWMDEVEEFVLLAKHYCISWGWRGWPDMSVWQQLPSSG